LTNKLETKSENNDSSNKAKKSDPIDINKLILSIYNNGEISNNLQSYLIIFNLRLKFNINHIELIKPIQNSTQSEITKVDQLSVTVNTALIPHQLKLNPKSFELSVGLNKLDINDEVLINGIGFEVNDLDFNSEFNWKLNFNIGEIIAITEIKSPSSETTSKPKTKANPKPATLDLPLLPFSHSINLNLSASINKTQLILTPKKLKLSQITDASYYLELGLNQLNLTSNLLNYHSTNKFEITSSLELSQLSISNEQSSFSLNTLEIINFDELQFDGLRYLVCTETSFDLQSVRLDEGELGFIYELLPYLNRLYEFKESISNSQNEGFSSTKNQNSEELESIIKDKTDSNEIGAKIPLDFKTHKLQLNLHRLSATLQSYNWNLQAFKEQIISYSDNSELPKDHLLPCPRPLSFEINSINLKSEGLPNNLYSITKFDEIALNVKGKNLAKLSYFSLVANYSDNIDEGGLLGLKGSLQKFEINYELSKVYYLLKLVHKVKDIKELVGNWLLNKGDSDKNDITSTSSNEDALISNKKNLNIKLEFSLFNLITKMELKEHQIIWIYLNHIQLSLNSSTLQLQGSDSALPSIELGLESIRVEIDPKVLPTVPNSIKFLSPPESEAPPSLRILQLDSIKIKLPIEKLLINQTLQNIVYVELTSLKFTVPDKVLIYEFIDELNLQVKTLKLLMKPELGTVLPPPLPSPMELKPNLPFVLDLKISEWVILIENNEFEQKLNRSVSVGWSEQMERMFLDSQLDFKMQTTSNDGSGATGGDNRVCNTGLQRPQFKRGPPTSSSFISQNSANTTVNKSSNDRRPDPQTALSKLKEVKSSRWIRKIQEFDTNYPILRAMGTKFHIKLSPTNLKATTKAGAVCLIDEQTPDDTKFDLFLSFHINLTQEQIIVRLRDYPIPLLHVPKLHPSQINSEDLKLSFNQVGEIIIAEPWGGLETAKWRTVSIDPDNNIPTVKVCKTLTPIKFYQHQRISILSRLPTTLTFGVAYRYALADMSRRLDTVTSPSFPNVCPLGWWDKARLQMHSKLKIEFSNDGEFRALMLGTDHPYIKSTNYSQIETKYGFQHTWKGGTCIKFKGNGVQNFSITSDCYRLVIPKLVLGENNRILGVVNPMGQFKQNWLKVVIKLKNFVTLESNWSYFKRHEFDPQLNIPIEVAHYQVIPKVPLENQLDYDPFRGFRSDRISILINIKSQPNSTTLVKRDIANSFHFTPQTWTCVQRFLQLFDSDRSLPIQLGDLFPKKLPPSSTPFSTRLFQIQFELNLHPTFVSYNLTVGPQNSKRDYVNLMDGVGIKGGSNALHLSIVMGKRNKILHDRENTDTPATPLTPGNSRQSNALEWYLKRMCFDVDQPDIRTVGVKYILPTKVDNHSSTNDPSSESTTNSKSSTSTRDKPFKPDEDGWLDPDDHKTPWNLTSESINISVKVQPFLSAPKLTYYSGEEYNGLNNSELPYDPLKLELNMYSKRLKYINKKLNQLEDFLNDTERCVSDEIIHLTEQQIDRMQSHKQKLEGIIGVKKNSVDDHSTWEGISYSRHLNVFQPIMLFDQTNQKHLHHFLFLMERDTALSDFWKRRYRSGLAQLEKRYHQTMKQMANLGRKGKKGKKEKFNSKGGSVYEKNSLESEKIFEEILNSFRFDSEPMDSAPASTTPDDLSTNQQDQVQQSQIITEPVWLINLYALQMVFLPNHDFVSDPLFQADTISSDSSVDDSLKSLVLSIYQTQLSIGKLLDNHNNQSFFGPVLIQQRYNLNLKYAQFFVTNDYYHHNHCSVYHALEIPYSKPCDETSLDRDYSNWVPIELIIPRCRGGEEDYLSTQEVIDNFKLEQKMNNMQYESIVLPFQSHLTYTRPNPLYVPNTPEECGGTDLTKDWSVQDHIHLEIPQFHLRTNGSQYFALLTNIQALLTYHEPRKRKFREQLDERSLLVNAIGWQQEFRRLCNLWDNYQDQILMYHQVLNKSHQVDSCSETLLNELQTLELDYLTCLDQLIQVISVLTDESKKQFSPSKTNSNGAHGGSPQGGDDLGSNLSKLIEMEIKEVDWNLLDTFDNNTSKPFCELKSKSVKLILNLDPDGGQRLRFLVEQVVGFNLIEDTRYIQLLTPHQSQQQNNCHRFTTGDMIHVYLKTLPKVGGMEVIDHLEINIFPCLIQITHAITMKVIDFLGLKHGISNNINRSSGLGDKKAIKDSSSINSDKLPLTTKNNDNFVIDLMKKRAQLNLTFIYIKVPATQLCMSYQGKKQTNFADLHQVTFKTPDLVYHNQTLSWLEFLELVKKEVIHAAFVQAGGLVKDLIMNKPPPSIGLGARSKVNSSSPLSRSGTQVSDSSNISGFNSPRSQVFYINNNDNDNQQQLHPGDAKSIATNETNGLEEGWQDTRSRLSLPHRLFGIPKLRVTSDHGDLASVASSKSTRLSILSNPALDRDENSSIGSTLVSGQSTGINTPNPPNFISPSPASSALPMRKGTSLDISKATSKYIPSHSIHSFAMSQTNSPIPIQFEFLRTSRHLGPDLARVIDPDIQLEVIVDDEFMHKAKLLFGKNYKPCFPGSTSSG
jgi:hypothetical protein